MINITENSSLPYFRYAVYQMYKLDWLIRHNYTLEDICTKVYYLIEDKDVEINHPCEIQDIIEEYGFNSGESWACYDEFIRNEYRDADYMKTLLRGNENYLELYKKDMDIYFHDYKLYRTYNYKFYQTKEDNNKC